MPQWSFPTSHARVLVRIAHDPGPRLRRHRRPLGITKRTAYGILTDLVHPRARARAPDSDSDSDSTGSLPGHGTRASARTRVRLAG